MEDNKENLEQNIDFDTKQKDTMMVKCDSCGGNMVFDPKSQKLLCPHCGVFKEFNKSSNVKELNIEDVLFSGEDKDLWDEETSVYRCENCGAVVVLEKSEAATLCPYCGTSHIVKSEQLAGLKPNAVYPFMLTAEEGNENAKKWAKKRIFAPSKFKKNLLIDNFKGVYQPCFTFDSMTDSTYSGRIGKRHTRTVGSGKNRRTETYIVWRNVSGKFDKFYDDVTVTTSSQLSQKNLNKLLPFNIETIKVYEQKYLSGFMAQRHEKDVKTSWSEAKEMIDEMLKHDILIQYDYDVVDYLNVYTTHNNVTYKYVMLPIYVLFFKYKKKLYNVYINGNTGKVVGKVPTSPLRVALATLIGAALLAGFAFLFYKLL